MREIIGKSKKIQEMMSLITRVASTKANILVLGDSGTGKELVARQIHELGPLAGKPFIPVNCGAIPESLMESEMFGHKRGSFTGAVAEKSGLFEVAHGGTLFLDEVGELPLSIQVKLLRAIQERTFRQVGGTEDRKVDVRIIAATNRDLEAEVKTGRFREDLFYRLNVIMIKTPPLRERREDIPILVDHFLAIYAKRQNKVSIKMDPSVMKAFEYYHWPGNIRELENVIERAVTLAEAGSTVGIASLPRQIIESGPVRTESSPSKNESSPGGAPTFIDLPQPDFDKASINLDEILQEVERKYLFAALEHAKGVKKRASDLLGITFRSIRYRLKKLGMDSDDDGEGAE